MARTLDLFIGETGQRVGSATLGDDGKVTFDGKMPEEVMHNALQSFPAEEVFHNYTGWSNGYLQFKPKFEAEE